MRLVVTASALISQPDAADHNEDDVFAVLPIPPKVRRLRGLPPKGGPLPRPSLQGRGSPTDPTKLKSISFKVSKDGLNTVNMYASGMLAMSQSPLGKADCDEQRQKHLI